MMSEIIHGLSNESYHDPKGKWGDYISSSQLKLYLKSPAAYKYAIAHPEEQTEAMKFGSLFHSLMASLAQSNGNWINGYNVFGNSLAVFEPPINARTGKPFGVTANPYKDAYAEFLTNNEDKTIAAKEDVDIASAMAQSLIYNCGSTSEQVLKLLKWGKPEVSIFHETEDAVKIKVRPDLLTSNKIVDWKTTNSNDLCEDAINRMILKFAYHISAAQYVWTYHEVTGKWVTFYLVIVSKLPPHDAVMVDMTNYAYRYLPDADIVIPGCGAFEFRRLLTLHTKCTKTNEWPGAETFISGDRYKILEIEPPRWYNNKFIDEI